MRALATGERPAAMAIPPPRLLEGEEPLKSMLRILSLSAVLASVALTSASASYNGTCRTYCAGQYYGTTVTWSTYKTRCCGLLTPPCPSGTTATGASWAASGEPVFCSAPEA